MQTPKPIWSERENRRFHLARAESTITVATAPAASLTPIWSSLQNSRFVVPALDPEVVLHATVREFEDHYLMVSDDDWTA